MLQSLLAEMRICPFYLTGRYRLETSCSSVRLEVFTKGLKNSDWSLRGTANTDEVSEDMQPTRITYTDITDQL